MLRFYPCIWILIDGKVGWKWIGKASVYTGAQWESFRVLTSLKLILNCFGRKPWRVLNKGKVMYIYILTEKKDYTRVQKKQIVT